MYNVMTSNNVSTSGSPADHVANSSLCSVERNESNADYIQLDTFRFIAPMSALVVFNLVVVAGNSLVIAAVFTYRKLRTVTNTFIVSLALSDLLLGVVVLPFSSVNEVLGRWPFGRLWCSAWLAVDVWLCTASILNLCAISLDRYLAISRPFRYPTLMSPSRAKIAVAVVWSLALAICVPPLLGWRDHDRPGSVVPVVPTDVVIVRPTDGPSASTTMSRDLLRLLTPHTLNYDKLSTSDREFSAKTINMTSAQYSHTTTTTTTRVSTVTPISLVDYHIDKIVSLEQLQYRASDGQTTTIDFSDYNLDVDEFLSDELTTAEQLVHNGAEMTDRKRRHVDANNDQFARRSDQKEDLPVRIPLSSTTTPSDPADMMQSLCGSVIVNEPCALTSEPGYIIYSACGSFWIPMLVMVFFYVKIYRTAVNATNALRRGVLTKKTGGRLASSTSDGSVNLRVHRGGGGGGGVGGPAARVVTVAAGLASAGSNWRSSGRLGGHCVDSLPRRLLCPAAYDDDCQQSPDTNLTPETGCFRRMSRIAVDTSFSELTPASPNPADAKTLCSKPRVCHPWMQKGRSSGHRLAAACELLDIDRSDVECSSTGGYDQLNDEHQRPTAADVGSTGTIPSGRRFHQKSPYSPSSVNCVDSTGTLWVSNGAASTSITGSNSHNGRCQQVEQSADAAADKSTADSRTVDGVECLLRSTLTPVYEQCRDIAGGAATGGHTSTELLATPHSRSRGLVQLRTQLRRLNREKKAAKTVGIIVGCFVLCWTPFFTVYVLGVFCIDCTPEVAFVIFFWLGYCNSAINPFVYALCSKDFRCAFRKLLRCGRRRRGRANSTLAALIGGLRLPPHAAPGSTASQLAATHVHVATEAGDGSGGDVN